MSYTADQFKKDIIINIKDDASYSEKILEALEQGKFEFEDSHDFTRREWDTYSRKLKIYCSSHNKAILETQKQKLYRFMDSFHGTRDNYMIMELNIFASVDMETVVVTSNRIIINKHIEIDKANDLIGTGGFSSVYKVEDEETGLIFAYKVFDPSPFQGSNHETMKKRFLREAKKVMGYSHENIVKAFEFGFLGNDSAFIKLEYIAGQKVLDYVRGVFLNEEDKCKLSMQYIDSMAYIHGKADIHRDISYSNVMINNDGNIKVLDFGFARGNEDTQYDTVYQDIIHKFSPPDLHYDIRTEMYCIGAILFSIFTEKDFHITIVDEITSAKESIATIILKCLEKNPDNRYKNAIELKNDFEIMLIEDSGPSCTNKPISKISLDLFEEKMNEIVDIEFEIGMLPTLVIIKELVEIQFPEFIEKHYFRSKMNFTQLIKQLPGVSRIRTFKNMNYDVDKNMIEEIYNVYANFTEKEKMYLIKGMHSIIIEHSHEIEELPFS